MRKILGKNPILLSSHNYLNRHIILRVPLSKKLNMLDYNDTTPVLGLSFAIFCSSAYEILSHTCPFFCDHDLLF